MTLSKTFFRCDKSRCFIKIFIHLRRDGMIDFTHVNEKLTQDTTEVGLLSVSNSHYFLQTTNETLHHAPKYLSSQLRHPKSIQSGFITSFNKQTPIAFCFSMYVPTRMDDYICFWIARSKVEPGATILLISVQVRRSGLQVSLFYCQTNSSIFRGLLKYF